jgi:DNA-binding response OmpR family regulator
MIVLVAEDNKPLASSLQRGFQENGFGADIASDGQLAADMGRSNAYDVIILDIMLPIRSGFDVIRELRSHGVGTPIICLTARDTLADRVTGLELGADDYLSKPFEFAELLARVRALTRRSRSLVPSRLTCRDLELDPVSREARRGQARLELTARETALLEFLLRRQGAVVSRTAILEHVWGLNSDPFTNVVDVFVNRLRNKVDYPFDVPLIHTVRGFGYTLADRENRP